VTPSNACSLLKISFFRGFIKISVTWSRVFTNLSCTSFLTMHSLIKWYLVSMRVVYNFQQTTPLFFHWFGSSWSHTHIYIYIYIYVRVWQNHSKNIPEMPLAWSPPYATIIIMIDHMRYFLRFNCKINYKTCPRSIKS